MPDTGSKAAQFGIEEPEVAGDSDGGWTIYHYCVTTIDTINQILIITLTVFLLSYFLRDYAVTNLHASLCTLGYVLLMSEAILVLATGNFLTRRLSRRAQSHVHWILQVLGLICVIAGVVIMYRVKKVHFLTIHAITGITATILACILAVFGYPVLVAAKLRKFVRPVIIKFAHNFLGIGCFVVGMVSQIYAYRYRWLVTVTNGVENVQLICIVMTALITLFSIRGAVCSLFSQAAALFK